MEALDLLGPDDVLVLDRGYPATWLVALLDPNFQLRDVRRTKPLIRRGFLELRDPVTGNRRG
jgi:hypothetical protein